MKKEVHPSYQKVLFIDSASGHRFVCGSTLHPDAKETFEGVEYPVSYLSISSSSHPFFTGSKQLVDSEGRVEKFRKRFGSKKEVVKDDSSSEKEAGSKEKEPQQQKESQHKEPQQHKEPKQQAAKSPQAAKTPQAAKSSQGGKNPQAAKSPKVVEKKAAKPAKKS